MRVKLRNLHKENQTFNQRILFQPYRILQHHSMLHKIDILFTEPHLYFLLSSFKFIGKLFDPLFTFLDLFCIDFQSCILNWNRKQKLQKQTNKLNRQWSAQVFHDDNGNNRQLYLGNIMFLTFQHFLHLFKIIF